MPFTFNPFTDKLDFYAASSGGTVTSVSGTANQVLVTNGTSTAVISLIGPYTPTTYTQNGVLYGNGTSSIQATAAGTNGQVLTATTGSAPTWASPATSGTVTSVSGTANQVNVATGTTTPVISLIGPYTPATYSAHGLLVGEGTGSIVALATGTAGQILQSGGATGDPAYSTTTYPTTNAINTILYASAANTMSALATANDGVLVTSSSGVPSIDATNFHVLSTGLQLKGNNTNAAPPAGFIGEQISSVVNSGAAVSLTSSVAANLTSITLTAGIWNISFVAEFSGGTAITERDLAIGLTSASFTGTVIGDSRFNSTGSNGSFLGVIPDYRLNVTATPIVYAVVVSTYTGGSEVVFGRISATRVG